MLSSGAGVSQTANWTGFKDGNERKVESLTRETGEKETTTETQHSSDDAQSMEEEATKSHLKS